MLLIQRCEHDWNHRDLTPRLHGFLINALWAKLRTAGRAQMCIAYCIVSVGVLDIPQMVAEYGGFQPTDSGIARRRAAEMQKSLVARRCADEMQRS